MSELRITFAGQTFTFEPGQTVRIGRSPDSAVVISDPIVSREHARISWHPDGWVLDDLGKGRTFVGGLPVASVGVQQPLDVHLATPLGPELRIELAGTGTPGAIPPGAPPAGSTPAGPASPGTASPGAAAHAATPPGSQIPAAAALASTAHQGPPAAGSGPERDESVGWGDLTGLAEQASMPGRVRHASAVHREELWRGDISGSHSSPAYQQLPAHHARLDFPGGDFATAVHILLPVRSWLKDPGWKQGSRLLVIAYGLLPSIFVVLFSATHDLSAPGWAYSLAIAPLWAVTFWVLIRPGPITRLVAWLAVAIVAGVMVLLPILTLPWEDALDKTADLHNLLPWFYGVGFAEEVTKALPILVAALLLRWVWKITLDVRIWMFLGTIAGLAFGVRESVSYTSSYLMQGNHQAGLAVPLILTFAQRVFVDGFQHAVWAGIAAFFIGMGVNYRRRRIPLILFGITLPAVLHGLNDWSTQLASHWLWIVMEAISLMLFIGYTMSAASIERQVRDTPLFRGDSMIMGAVPAADQVEHR
ncbi:MAG TPA: PrsW family glutamic-type intramembrane protease [Streptosporangiaceae bacterium]|nr:PrsW family glutamic-type intramembrane protease [Streptosporangiaceae bacterium]HUZ50959.1 PrsW family glutamic-type intramembrane protease [Streptosporangiaceae bacterium]